MTADAHPERPTWMVTGAAGLLGRPLCGYLKGQGHRVVAAVHRHRESIVADTVVHVDLRNDMSVNPAFSELTPDVVVHAAALTDVDACERDPGMAIAMNAEMAGRVAEWARSRNAAMVFISSDQLWRGDAAFQPETEVPDPINEYGRSKALGERMVVAANADALIVRTNFYGAGSTRRMSLSDAVLATLSAGRPFHGFTDSFFTPLSITQLCDLLYQLVASRARGVFHLASRDRISKHEFALRVCRAGGFPEDRVVESRMADAGLAAPRPRDMSLSCARAEALLGRAMPSVDDGIAADVRLPAASPGNTSWQPAKSL